MLTGSSRNDFEAFYHFLGDLRQQKSLSLSPEESLKQFREEQKLLQKFHDANQVSIEQSQQGLSGPLDLSAMMDRIEQRVAAHGTSN